MAHRSAHETRATTRTLALVNQTAIIDMLTLHGPMTKVRLGELTGLSPATINRLVPALIAEGRVAENGAEASTGGRPAKRYSFVGTRHVVLACELRSNRLLCATVDFEGTVVDRQSRSLGSSTPTRTWATLSRTIGALTRRAAERGTPPLGIGISVTGIVDPNGTVVGLDPVRWGQVSVDRLTAACGSDVHVENDANALAIGELHRGIGRTCDNFVALLLETGLGAGIVTNGALYRGRHHAAGEVGYLLVERNSLRRNFRESGDLESRITPETISQRAREAGLEDDAAVSAFEIIARAVRGEDRVRTLADAILDDIARALAALSSVLDPDAIVLGQGLDHDGDVVISALRERLEGRIQFVPEIRHASLGPDATLLGAAEVAIRAASDRAYVGRS